MPSLFERLRSVVSTSTSRAPRVAPSADTDAISLAQLHLTTTMTSIKDTNDGTNGYIIDARAFL